MEKKFQRERLNVGIWFHQSHWQGNNTGFLDDLIKEVERQGANALPVFFSGAKDESLGVKGLEWVIDNYFVKDGKPTVDVVVSVMSFSLTTALTTPDAVGPLKRLNVPVIKAITTCNTFQEWRDTKQGLSVMDVPANIAMPSSTAH